MPQHIALEPSKNSELYKPSEPPNFINLSNQLFNMKETRNFLIKLGLPPGDLNKLTSMLASAPSLTISLISLSVNSMMPLP